MSLDYETLRLLWWLLLGILLIGFAILDGLDLGIAIWQPWLCRTETEKRILMNASPPTWNGHQVFFIVGAGAIFVAWPALYTLAFSGFYIPMLAILLSLIIRPLGFKYRSKVEKKKWRAFWDLCLFVGGFIPSLLFGLTVGKIIEGVPFYFDDHLRIFSNENFSLPNSFSLLCGFVSVSMLAMHGAFYIRVKTEGHLQRRAAFAAKASALVTIVLFIFAGIYLHYNIDGYAIIGSVVHDGPSNPLYKSVIRIPDFWFRNFERYPALMLIPTLGIFGPILAMLFSKIPKTAFVFSAISLFGIIATVGVSMFPFIIPSISNPHHSLIVWDSSSSLTTLMQMFVAALGVLLLVLCYAGLKRNRGSTQFDTHQAQLSLNNTHHESHIQES